MHLHVIPRWKGDGVKIGYKAWPPVPGRPGGQRHRPADGPPRPDPRRWAALRGPASPATRPGPGRGRPVSPGRSARPVRSRPWVGRVGPPVRRRVPPGRGAGRSSRPWPPFESWSGSWPAPLPDRSCFDPWPASSPASLPDRRVRFSGRSAAGRRSGTHRRPGDRASCTAPAPGGGALTSAGAGNSAPPTTGAGATVRCGRIGSGAVPGIPDCTTTTPATTAAVETTPTAQLRTLIDTYPMHSSGPRPTE